jgi:hypothetical protein
MAALQARKSLSDQTLTTKPAQEAASPWIAGIGAHADAGARNLQSLLKADLYTGRLEQTDRPPPYSPAKGVLAALVPSLLMWWGVASAIHALTHHGH